jgi:lipopolysaccharide export system protein LptA
VVKNVRFTLHHDNKRYQGRCEELIYFPKRREYVLKKDVFVHQLPDEKKIYAQSIVLALGQGRIDVKGKERQPVKMILRLEEQNATTH